MENLLRELYIVWIVKLYLYFFIRGLSISTRDSLFTVSYLTALVIVMRQVRLKKKKKFVQCVHYCLIF